MNRGWSRGLPREMPSFRGLSMNGPLRSVYMGENQSSLATTTDCVIIGDGAGGFSLRSAINSVIIGSGAGANVVDLAQNTYVGYQAGAASVTSNNVAIGYLCATGTAGSGGGSSVAVGGSAVANGGFGVAVGQGANIPNGNTGSVAVGAGATAFAGTVSIGLASGQKQTGTTALNTFVGYQSGFTGTSGANGTTTGTGQTCLGNNTGQASTTVINYITAIGAGVTVGASGAIAIGVDSAGTAATTSVGDEIVLGTTLSGLRLGNLAGSLTATTGHVYLPLVAGAPTGVPTAKTNYAAHLVDSTNGKLWAYYGAAWHFVALT